ncbi:MAG: hypothetical protein IJY93_04580 [Clostridia bacterium]|nr:hypothetical protein [Clostridia bacterium]
MDNNATSHKKCCPKCKSRNLQIVTNTEFSSQTKGGGYSTGKGCCGYILLGPLGLLCGGLGSKSKTTVTSKSTTTWTCLDCGNKFRDIADIEKDIESTLRTAKIFPILLYILGALTLISVPMEIFSLIQSLALWGGIDSRAIAGILLSAIPAAICIVGAIVVKRNLNNRLYALYEEKKDIEKNGYTD